MCYKKKKSNIVQQTINNNNLLNISDINIIYNNPEFKELVISSILNKLNLPIDSPYRHIIDINLNTILINSDLSEQIESNMNNANDNLTNFINLFDNLNIDPLQLNVGCDEIEINDDLRNKFKDELDEIKLMGFNNDHLILRTLAESNGMLGFSI